MKNKKILFLLLIVLAIIVVAIYFIIKSFNSSSSSNTLEDYNPEEEISQKQLRETLLTLYFLENDSGNLKPEGKLIDSAELIKNPYVKMIELLIQGPADSKLKSVFPENTKILGAKVKNHCATLDFSQEITNFEGDAQKFNIINSILNTLATLNEISSIKFLVNGNTSSQFDEEYFVNIHWQKINNIVV